MLSSELARRVDLRRTTPAMERLDAPEGFKVLVIGAGVAGIAAAQQLEDMGVDYIILEKQPEPGGNWLQNTYPGAGVDTPSHLYSFSFAKNDWAKHFELRDDLQAYFARRLKDVGARGSHALRNEVLARRLRRGRAGWHVEVRGPDGASRRSSRRRRDQRVGVLNQPGSHRPGHGHVRRHRVPLRRMARGPRPGRQAGRHRRHRAPARCRSCPAIAGAGGAPDDLPALAPVGGPLRQVPQPIPHELRDCCCRPAPSTTRGTGSGCSGSSATR